MGYILVCERFIIPLFELSQGNQTVHCIGSCGNVLSKAGLENVVYSFLLQPFVTFLGSEVPAKKKPLEYTCIQRPEKYEGATPSGAGQR
jgi:hypothetical protein